MTLGGYIREMNGTRYNGQHGPIPAVKEVLRAMEMLLRAHLTSQVSKTHSDYLCRFPVLLELRFHHRYGRITTEVVSTFPYNSSLPSNMRFIDCQN
jgi:hypothetical protein